MRRNFGKINLLIYITAAIAVAFLIRAIAIGSKAIFDSCLVLVLLFVLYKYKKNLKVNNWTMLGASVFLVLHLIGAHGMYDFYIYGSLGYDKMLHFYGPFILCMMVFNYIDTENTKWDLGHRIFFAVLITLGINAFQEVMEFCGNTLLGNGEGVFFYGSGDLGGNDTPKDLIANFLGASLSGAIMYLRGKIKK